MRKKKPAALYRSMVTEAWNITRQRKQLWVFGIFAALISTGGIVDVGMSALRRVKQTGQLFDNLMDSSFFGYTLFGQYVRHLEFLGSSRFLFLMLTVVLVVIGTIVASVLSQGSLVSGVRAKQPKDPYQLRKKAWNHFWDILMLAVVIKIISWALTLITTLPLLLVSVELSAGSVLMFFAHSFIYFPLILLLNILGVLALIDIVSHDNSVFDALHHALEIIKTHALATFEFAVMIFFIVYLSAIAFLLLLTLLFVPYAIFYTAALLTGSFTAFLLVNIAYGMLMLFLILLFGGALVTFQYAAWVSFYKRATHKTLGRRTVSKLLRWVHA